MLFCGSEGAISNMFSRVLRLCICISLLLCAARTGSAQTTRPSSYMVIPLRGEIGREVTAAGVEAALAEARKVQAQYVIFYFDTPGGSPAEAQQISGALERAADLKKVALVKLAMGSASALARGFPKTFVCHDSRFGDGAASDEKAASADEAIQAGRALGKATTFGDLRKLLGVDAWECASDAGQALMDDPRRVTIKRVTRTPQELSERIRREKQAAAEIAARNAQQERLEQQRTRLEKATAALQAFDKWYSEETARARAEYDAAFAAAGPSLNLKVKARETYLARLDELRDALENKRPELAAAVEAAQASNGK